jgi:cell wall-associated NlpC family hydrolase
VAARHRAAGSAITPLSIAVSTTVAHASLSGRRGVVMAASSGLVVSMLASPASAAHSHNEGQLPTVDTRALTASARTVLETSPVVSVPSDAAWTFDVPAITVVADPPPPPPPAPVEAAPSRSQVREAAAESAPAEIGAPAPASANGNAIVEIASLYVGVPYLWGGTTPDGFDCSGFTSYVYAQVGIALPRTSGAQRDAGTVVPFEQAQPGDLIWTPGHISIYAGGNTQIDAPVPGKTIQIREIWQSNPTFIRVG